MVTTPDFTIRNRAELVDALSVAAQVEHIVLVEYLYAAFSCRHTLDPTVPQDVQLTSWELARDLYEITHDEMDHLGAVQQLLAALGAPPVADAWAFPVRDPRVPFAAELTRLDLAAAQRFVTTESPPSQPALEALPTPPDPIRFDVLGDLYRAIVAGLETLGDEVFLGAPVTGPDPSPLTFRSGGMPVANAAEAVDTIRTLVQEGEGSSGTDPDGHWQRFQEMCDRLGALEARAELVSWPCVRNPVLRDTGNPDTTVLTDPTTVAVADIANRAYRALWLLLGGTYLHDWSTTDVAVTVASRQLQQRRAMRAARWVMAAVVRPLGEMLARLPAFAGQPDGPTAGMCFEQYGEFRVPAQPDARREAALAELARIAADLDLVSTEPPLAAPWAGPRLAALARDVTTIRARLAGTVGEPLRDRFEPAAPGPWLAIDFQGWYQVRLATGGDPYNDPRGVSGWQFAFPGEPDLDRVLRLRPEGAFLRPHIDPQISIGVSVTSASVGPGPILPAFAGAAVDLLDEPVFEGHNGVVTADGDEPIVPLRLQIAGADVRLERSALDSYAVPYHELATLGMRTRTQDAAGALRAAHGVPTGAALPAHLAAARARLQAAIDAIPDPAAVSRRILERRRDDMIEDKQWYGAALVWRLRLSGSDAVVQLPDGMPVPATDATWWLELLSTGFDQDSGCALLRGVLHLPLLRDDGSAGPGPPPWRMTLAPAAPGAPPSMAVDAMGVRTGR